MATLRLRKPGGGSTLRGGDGMRAPDKRVFSYVGSGGLKHAGSADLAKTKSFEADGGIEFGGTAGVSKTKRFAADGGIEFGGIAITQFVDGRGYIASGGIVFGGSASTEFKSARQPDHGAGFFVTRTAGIPIKRWQYGHARVEHDRIYRASGGIKFGGAASTSYTTGEQVRAQREDEEFLLLAMT